MGQAGAKNAGRRLGLRNVGRAGFFFTLAIEIGYNPVTKEA
jgi:hypothetical protein